MTFTVNFKPVRPGLRLMLMLLIGSGLVAAVVKNEGQLDLGEYLRQAETALKEDRLEEAYQECQNAISLNPRSAQALYLLGKIHDGRGDQQKAKQALFEALKLSPTHIPSHNYLGNIFLRTNEWAEATKEFQASVRLGDTSGTARYGLGLVLIGQSKYAQALPHLLAAVAASPRDTERLFTLTATQLQLKQVGRAQRSLAEIEKLSSANPWVLFRLGTLLLEHHLPKQAETEFERSASLLEAPRGAPIKDLKLAEVYLQIAQLRFNRFDYLGVLRYLDMVQPQSVDTDLQAAALDLRGAALLALGNVREARAKYRQAVQLDCSEPNYLAHLAWAELLAGENRAAVASAEVGKGKWPQAEEVQRVAGLIEREKDPERAGVPFTEDWHLKGEGVVCCPCAVPCPCRSNAPPTHGHCEPAGAIRVTQGHYGNTPLDGLLFATVTGSMGPATVPTVLYVDQSATVAQFVALERVLQTFKPMQPLASLKVKRVKMTFPNSPDEIAYELRIPGLLHLAIRRQLDEHGQPLFPTAALDYFSNTIEYARNVIYKASDEESSLKWDFSGRQANFRKIDLDSGDYRGGTMLVQYADGSGFFTERQLQLIKKFNLPMLRDYPK
jgi:tetratricopeptide (TPR) repeat protein